MIFMRHRRSRHVIQDDLLRGTHMFPSLVQRTMVTIAAPPEDPRAKGLVQDLELMEESLERIHQDVLRRLRRPLDPSNTQEDLARRLQEHEKAALALQKLESEKGALQRDIQPLVSQKPLGPTSSRLPLKLSSINHKMDHISALMVLYQKKASASLFLERHLQTVDGLVSGFEEQLVKDGVLLDAPSALPNRSLQLQSLQKDVVSHKDELNKLGKELELTQQNCSSLQQNFSEFCPDIQRQETQVRALRNRYSSVTAQLADSFIIHTMASAGPGGPDTTDTTLWDFLRGRGVSESGIREMQQDKLHIEIISEVEDSYLARYIPAYGDRIATRRFYLHQAGKTVTDNQTHRPRLSDPQTSDSQTHRSTLRPTDLRLSDPQIDSQTHRPQTLRPTDLRLSDPQTSDSQTHRPQTLRPTDLRLSDPQIDSQTHRPQTLRPTDLRLSDPQTSDSQTHRPQTLRPTDLRLSDPQTSDSQTHRPQTLRPTDLRLSDPQTSDSQTHRPQTLRPTDLRLSDPQIDSQTHRPSTHRPPHRTS
uniref:Uncharacterized protein n=1 Tax=Knipowitschia caucasica TaxID=637954 RepID=A0AAV2KKB6_KNICA